MRKTPGTRGMLLEGAELSRELSLVISIPVSHFYSGYFGHIGTFGSEEGEGRIDVDYRQSLHQASTLFLHEL